MHHIAARDGNPIFVKGPLTSYHVPQCHEQDPELKEKIDAKLTDVRDKGYIGKGDVENLTG